MSEFHIAVIGVGALGRHHARILSEMPGVHLVAVVDPNPQNGKKVAEAHGARWLPDYHLLLDENCPLDGVCVAVPTSHHCAIASEFLRRRIPTFIEKPIAANVEQAELLTALAERHHAVLQVGHVERFNPAMTAGRPYCDSPTYIHAERLSPFSYRSTDIGVIHDLMIHDIDLVLSLVDSDVVHVEALGIGLMGTLEDSVRARLQFANGCIADLVANRVNPQAKRAMDVWSGSRRTLIDFGSREVIHYRPSETLLFGTPPVERAAQPGADIEQLKRDVFGTFLEVTEPEVKSDDALTAELAHFIEAVLTESRPECDGVQALNAMKVAEQIQQKVNSHQWDGHSQGKVGPHFRLAAERKRAG